MERRRLALVVSVLALITILGVASVGAVYAQADTPSTPAPTTPDQPKAERLGRSFGFGLRGGDVATFDTVASALKLTPTQLFEQLHSGKTLSEIAAAQGVELSAVQAAVNASKVQAMKDRIAQAVQNGTITQEQADWLLQGIEKGWAFGKGSFGFGFGGRGHGRGTRGLPFNNGSGIQQPAPSTSGLGTSS